MGVSRRDLVDREAVEGADGLRDADGRVAVSQAALAHGVGAPGVDGAVLGQGQAGRVADRDVHDPGLGELLDDLRRVRGRVDRPRPQERSSAPGKHLVGIKGQLGGQRSRMGSRTCPSDESASETCWPAMTLSKA